MMASSGKYGLLDVCEDGEHREVIAIEGASLAVMETSSGPVTELAYGTERHGHKVLCDRASCARALGVPEESLVDALTSFYAKGDDHTHLSDLMDQLDRAGERYTYVAWGGDGTMAVRHAEGAPEEARKA